MARKETSEQRNYYKPFRCVAGFILSLAVIIYALQGASSGITFMVAYVFHNPFIQELFTSAILYGCIGLSYYLGYRIFFRKYVDRFYQFEPVRRKDIISLVPICLGTFFYGLACWQLWGLVVDFSSASEGSLSLISILYACIGAPVMEELVFRYWIRKVMKPYGCWCYVLISALSFGLFHGTVEQSVPAIFIGLGFGLIAWHYDSIIPTVLLHVANNTLSTVESLTSFGINESLVYIIAGIFLLVMLILTFRKIPWKELKKPVRLIPHSISYIVFIVFYVVIIVVQVILQHYLSDLF